MAKMMTGAATDTPFRKIQTSSEVYAPEQLEGLTALANVKQETLVSNVERTNETAIRIEGAMNNTELTEGYKNQTVGIIAVDPDEGEILYGVTIVDMTVPNNAPNFIPAFNNVTSTGINFDLIITVGNSENVTLEVDPAAVATINQLNALKVIVQTNTDEIADIRGFIGYTDDDIFGLEADFQNSKFTRLASAVNRSAGAGFDDIACFGGRRRCIVTDGGVILAYYGETGYTETGALTVAIDSSPVGTPVQVMVYQPKFYYRVVPLVLEPIGDTIGFHMRKARYYVSATPKSGFKIHPAFIKDGTERAYVLIGAYEGCLQQSGVYNLTDAQTGNFAETTGDKLSSIANAKPVSGLTHLFTRTASRVVAANRGANWSQTYAAIASATQMLMMIEYGAFETQSIIGRGVVDFPSGTGNESINTGGTSSLGNASGMAAGVDGQVSISYRGEENPWGNIWVFVDGINVWGNGSLRGGIPFIADNAFAESERNTAKYKSAGFTFTNVGGYISAFGYGEPDFDWLFMASETLGNSNLPVGDYNWVTADLNDWRIALLGGSWAYGSYAGGFYWNVYNAVSGRYRSIGGRLVYVPPVA